MPHTPPDSTRTNREPGAVDTSAAEQVRTLLTQAVDLHRSGDLAGAAKRYAEVLQLDPEQFDARHMLGVLAQQQGDTDSAIAWIETALTHNPRSAAAHCNLGIALRSAGDPVRALGHFDVAIGLDANYVQAYLSRANTHWALGQFAAAVQDGQHAARLDTGHASALLDMAEALRQFGKTDLAMQAYTGLFELGHASAAAHNNLGTILQAKGHWESALQHYDAALCIDPCFAQAHHNRATVLQAAKAWEAARQGYELAIRYQPTCTESINNLGLVLQAMGKPQDALQAFSQVLQMAPDNVAAHNNRGLALHRLGELTAALASFDTALSLDPDFAQGHSNRGVVLQDLGQLHEAIRSYDRALERMPADPETVWNKGLTLLMSGDFSQGWPLYEWRWRRESFSSPKRPFVQPLWLGESALDGQTILLHAEQGLGDTIQFCRYAAMVKARGAGRVVLEVPGSLVGLMQGLGGVDEVVASGQPLPEFDMHCPLLSLPMAMKTTLATIPSPGPYLMADPTRVAKWAQRLGDKRGLRVGLVWRGSAWHGNDHHRSIQLQSLLFHLPPSLDCVSLQQNVRDDEAPLLRRHGIRHFGSELNDFTDTAALASCMDGVISVDTSVAHLCGALGLKTWIVLPAVSDWRWLRDREDSPWYDSVRLWRLPAQSASANDPLAAIGQALRKLIQDLDASA